MNLKIISVILLITCNLFAGNPEKKLRLLSSKENTFASGWCSSIFTDITFYGGKPVTGYGISLEPSINEYISLNYKYAINIKDGSTFSVHGNPGTVVSPYMFSMINLNDSNKSGQIFWAILALLIPEGVNFKYAPEGFSKIAFAGYLNPIGVDFARRKPEMDKTIYVSGEIGAKVYFAVKNNLYASVFGGFRTIYRFGIYGLSVGVHAGWVFGGTTLSKEEPIYY